MKLNELFEAIRKSKSAKQSTAKPFTSKSDTSDAEDKHSKIPIDIIEEYKKHFSEWPLDKPLYRFTDRANRIQIGDTEGKTRISKAGSAQIQKYLMDRPEWQGNANRFKSIFTSTSKNPYYASFTSAAKFVVIPANNAKLAACKGDFNNLEFDYDGATVQLFDLNGTAWNMMDYIGSDLQPGENRLEVANKLLNNPEFKDAIREYIYARNPNPTWIEVLKNIDTALSPENVGIFEVDKSNLNKIFSEEHEVWIEGKYMLIPVKQWEEFKEKVSE